MTKEFGELVYPKYGFACTRPFDLGPSYCAIGIEKGQIPDEEAESIAGQTPGSMHGYFAHGFLRDIFPWNCLSKLHLCRRIDGTSLEQWIKITDDRGKLEPFVGDTYSWVVPEQNLARLRAELKRADIIFDHMKHLQTPAAHYHEQGVRGELGYENVAARVFLELGVPTDVKPAPKLDANIFVEPSLPPTTPEDALRTVMQEMGYDSAEKVQVIKSLGDGKIETLSDEQVRRIADKNRKPKKRK
ncbi:MAG: hypothetical protein FJ271_23215 [Planctomycetes bacterium]|nr:hypothetical protein [Planctomycetota bacterium]